MPPNSTDLNDAAFVVSQQNAGNTAREARRKTRADLSAPFPDVPPRTLSRACNLANNLRRACYDIGDLCRAEILTREQAEAQLHERFPGFSSETYSRAVSYGMFISR